MAFDIGSAVGSMLAAAKGPLETCWKEAEPFAKTQFTAIAHTVACISEAVAAGQMTRQQAAYLLKLQEHASKSALLAVEGLGIVAVESAINGALESITSLVNGALGFAIL